MRLFPWIRRAGRVILFGPLAVWMVAVFFMWVFSGGPPGSGRPALSAESPEPDAAPEVLVGTLEGVINPVAAEYVTEVIEAGSKQGFQAVVIRMDTPGGLDTSMRLIIKQINASTVPVVVYVAPPGARAASAGVFITLASHVAAMAPGTNIGAAHPVAMGGGEMDKEMKSKVENDAAAYIKSIAETHGRNAEWAEEAVRKSVSVTETEALKLKIIDLVAPDLKTLLEAIDGRTVETASGKKKLKTASARVVEMPMSSRHKILGALSDPNIAYILMLLGMYGLIFELSNPGSILPGIVGAICLILAFYSFQTLPINYAGLLLILLAIVLFIAETQVPSFGLLTMGGVVSMILGSIMLIKTDLPFMRISWWVILPTVLATAAFFILVVGMAWKAHHRRPVSGTGEMIGAVGTARSDLKPRGQIQVRGEIWDAVSPEPIARGESVEVVQVEGLKLHVKKTKPT